MHTVNRNTIEGAGVTSAFLAKSSTTSARWCSILAVLVFCQQSFGVDAFCSTSHTTTVHFAEPAAAFISSPSLFQSAALLLLTPTLISSKGSSTALCMARPGQSEAQARKEREDEIRGKLAKLKADGKMKGGTAESMMEEAEQFFSKESPTRKFERSVKKRREAALQKEKDEAEGTTDDTAPAA